MNNITRFIWNYYKFRYLANFNSRQELVDWQEVKIQKFIKSIIAKSDFYRRYYAGFDPKDWRSFPMIDKQIMMENFNQLNTENINKDEAFKVAFKAEASRDFSSQVGLITVGLSSGTSGNRGLFLASPAERAIWAGAILAKTLPNGILGGERIAFFLRANSNLYETINSRYIKFKFFDLLNTIEEHLDDLQQFYPSILVAPPSMLRLLAEMVSVGRLKLAPKKIISVAEVLEPLDAEYIKAQFKQTVHQIYQCTEGFLGVTCVHGTLHINEDIVCVQKEYIDEGKKRFIPVITDFTRTTQPIIRYRLNDILVEKAECHCGSKFMAIEAIEGRTDDVFYLQAKNGVGVIAVFPDFIRREIMMTSADISEYKVDQLDYGTIVIYLSFKPRSAEEEIKLQLLANFRLLFAKLRCVIPMITFSDKPYKNSAYKLRRVERKFKLD